MRNKQSILICIGISLILLTMCAGNAAADDEVDWTIVLTPGSATTTVGTSHTITATVTNPNDNNKPVADWILQFSLKYPNINPPAHPTFWGVAQTNSNGIAEFSYLGENIGTDRIYAVGTQGPNNYPESNVITSVWVSANVAPAVEAGPDANINEGDTFTSSGSFTYPGADTWTATVDYGDGSGVQPLALTTDKTFSLSYVYADNGLYTVTVTVTDDDGGVGTDTALVIVNNVAPTVTASGTTINENDSATISSTITDPGTSDTFQVVINWGDGTADDTYSGRNYDIQ